MDFVRLGSSPCSQGPFTISDLEPDEYTLHSISVRSILILTSLYPVNGLFIRLSNQNLASISHLPANLKIFLIDKVKKSYKLGMDIGFKQSIPIHHLSDRLNNIYWRYKLWNS